MGYWVMWLAGVFSCLALGVYYIDVGSDNDPSKDGWVVRLSVIAIICIIGAIAMKR